MEEQHPIEGLMVTAMNSIKQMIDVNTIIGEPIKALNNTVIIPISKVSFGFAAGGSEFTDETINSYNKREKEENIKYRLPFGGGSGAGVNIIPVAFLIVQNDTVKLLEANHSSVLDKLVEYVPDIIDKVNNMLTKKINNDEENFRKCEENFDWDDDDFSEEISNKNEEYYTTELEEDINEESSSDKKVDSTKNMKNKDRANKKTEEIKKEISKKNNKNNKRDKFEKVIKEVNMIKDEEE